MKLIAVPAHGVRGLLLFPDGTPAPNVSVVGSDGTLGHSYAVESSSDGTFQVPPEADGEWHLSAQLETHDEVLRASRWIEIAGHDLDNIELYLNRPFTVRGRIVMEGPTKLVAETLPAISLRPAPNQLTTGELPHGKPDGDGNFDLENVYPGAYELLAPSSTPSGYYLDTVQLGQIEWPEGGASAMEIISGAAEIILVYRANGGTVWGTVENCRSGEVVLVARDHQGRVGVGRCDANDRYQIGPVRPGQYYVLAFEGASSMPIGTARKVAHSLLDRAISIAVRAGEVLSAHMSAIPLPEY